MMSIPGVAGFPTLPLKAFSVHRYLGWYQKIRRVLVLTNTGCEILKNKSEMTVFFSYLSITQIKKLYQGIIQISVDENVSYFFTAQDPDAIIKELIKRINAWISFTKDVQSLELGEISDVSLMIPSPGVFSPPIAPYSSDNQINNGNVDNIFFGMEMGRGQNEGTTKGSNIYKSYNTKFDRITGTTIIDRVYSHVLKLVKDPMNKGIQNVLTRFKQSLEKRPDSDNCIKFYHIALKKIRDQILKDNSNDFAKIFTEKYCRDPEAYSELEETTGRCIESILMSVQLNNKHYVFDLFKKFVEKKWKNKSLKINEAMNDLHESGNLNWDVFEIKQGLRDQNNYEEVCDDILKIHEEYKRDGEYYISRNIPLPTPSYLLTKQIDIINKVNQLISERSPNGKKARAKGDFFIVGAEDFNPVFEMCIARARSNDIYLLSAFAKDYLDPILGDREKGYYSTSILGILESIVITCNKAHEEDYKRQLSALLDKEHQLEGIDKIIESLEDGKDLRSSLQSLGEYSRNYLNVAQKLSLELEPIAKKEKFTTSLVTEKLEEKLKNISFSRSTLWKFFIDGLPLSFRKDVLLGFNLLSEKDFPNINNAQNTRDIKVLVDYINTIDDSKTDDIPLRISRIVVDTITFGTKQIRNRNQGNFEELLCYAFMKSKNFMIYPILFMCSKVLVLYGKKSNVLKVFYDASCKILAKMNEKMTELYKVLFKNEDSCRDGDLCIKEKDSPASQDNDDHSKDVENDPSSLIEELEKYNDVFSKDQLITNVVSILKCGEDWPNVSSKLRDYVINVYRDLAGKDGQKVPNFSKLFVPANAVIMDIFSEGSEIHQSCIELISKSLPTSAEVDNRFIGRLSSISKSFLPDVVLAHQEFLKHIAIECIDELKAKINPSIADRSPEDAMGDICYSDVIPFMDKSVEKADVAQRSPIKFIEFVVDLLFSGSVASSCFK